MEIIVYRNSPAGARCNQLVENVLTAIIDSIDELDKEITVKILYAKDNIEAPAIEINNNQLGKNLSMEKIVQDFSPEKIVEIIRS